MTALPPTVVFFNPVSGRGRSEQAARQLEALLVRDGGTVRLVPTERQMKAEAVAEALCGMERAVIAGGDGTVMLLLEVLAERAIPFYVLPTGNQSLCARHFGMSAEPSRAVQAIRAGRCAEHHFGRINGAPFFHMASVGLDSQVVAAVAAARTGTVSNLSYALPALKLLLRYRAPTVTVRIDGKLLIEGEQGALVAANTRAYACRLDPVPDASSTDSELSIRFFPRGAGMYLEWGLCALLRCPVSQRSARGYRGRRIEVELLPPDFPVQADGELVTRGSFLLQSTNETARILLPPTTAH